MTCPGWLGVAGAEPGRKAKRLWSPVWIPNLHSFYAALVDPERAVLSRSCPLRGWQVSQIQLQRTSSICHWVYPTKDRRVWPRTVEKQLEEGYFLVGGVRKKLLSWDYYKQIRKQVTKFSLARGCSWKHLFPQLKCMSEGSQNTTKQWKIRAHLGLSKHSGLVKVNMGDMNQRGSQTSLGPSEHRPWF